MSLKELAENTGDAIAIHYVPLDDLKDTFLDGNSKKHDTDKLIESIRRYGFRDPIAFLGSGTTLIAAEQCDRTCYGVELSEKYCDVILQRWENLTGEKAKMIKNIG